MSQRRNFHNNYKRALRDVEDCHCKHHKDFEDCDVCNREEGELVERVVCSKNVQSVAEFALPASVEPGPVLDLLLGLLAGLTNIVVTPNYAGIQQEITVIRDKIIVLGFIPATLDVTGTLFGILNPRIPIRIYFQEHVECPGVCPGDQIIQSTPTVEAELRQPLLATGPNGTSLNLFLFKAIVRMHVTAVRTGIERNGKICDLDNRRCTPVTGPVEINSPVNLSANTTALSTPTPPPAT
ncbi:hypothetical protein P5G51_006125 [Virgibacillus sp. 179-BFC.A HS]|uniref:SipL SPOCS domain-containing protein n=1 Tax=Tigheibacillus jepli TaxID=3035914 RepID=A0ABU5CFG4_9BACI|nr:hypothetical protein [Virgibacillus sp. 179-BFC.A HS]MDY0405031.1 hypothetical protein [Virgibacillus sp. 179-BFC.A HS]